MAISPTIIENVPVRGGTLHVRVYGSGSPIVMVHGWPLDYRAFTPQIEGLSNSHTIIAYDRRGFGRSTAPPDLRMETADINEIVSAIGIEDFHLLGMSQGGRVALRYAATHEESLRSLVLQGTAMDGFHVDEPEEERVPLDEFVELAKTGNLEAVRERWSAHPMMKTGNRDAKPLIQRILASYNGSDLVHFDARCYRYEGDLESKLRRLRTPTLILTGRKDSQARQACARRLLELIPNAEEIVFENAGHLSNFDASKAFNAAVRRFCSQIDAETFSDALLTE